MREFVFGTQEFFNSLNTLLDDGNCHVFNNIKLPSFCTPSSSRLGFEKRPGGGYLVLIDYGISAECDDMIFKSFLVNGEKEFNNINEIKAFFHSFSKFYETEKDNDTTAVFDEEKLLKLREEHKRITPISSKAVLAKLKEKIFGQDNALELLSKKLTTHLNSNRNKPLVVVLDGTPGVGKSFTGQNIAGVLSELTDKKYSFIEESTNTCLDSFSVYKYLGAPPGYIGYGEKTVFADVADNPYHIILLNEIDKTDNALLVALMEAFDSGIFCLSNGNKIDMSRCIFILTTNMAIDYDKYHSFDNNFDRTNFCRDIFTDECGHSSIARRIDEFILYSPLNEVGRANIIIRFIKDALAPYNAMLYKIDEHFMSSVLDLNSTYGGDSLGQYVTTVLINTVEENDLYDEIREKQLVIKGTIKDLIIEVLQEDNSNVA